MGQEVLKDVLRIVSMVLGLVALILGMVGSMRYWAAWDFFISMVFIFLILSVVWFILVAVVVDLSDGVFGKIDVIYHFVGGVLLLISALIWLISWIVHMVNYCGSSNDQYCQGIGYFRIACTIISSILTIVNGVIYLLIGKKGMK